MMIMILFGINKVLTGLVFKTLVSTFLKLPAHYTKYYIFIIRVSILYILA